MLCVSEISFFFNWTSKLSWITVIKVDIFVLFLILQEMLSVFFTIQYDVSCGFVIYDVYYVEVCSLWRRQWHPAPVLLPGKSHGWRSLVGCSPWGLRVGHDWATSLSLSTLMHWKRKWQPTPVFLPGESHGRRSLVGCSPWGHTESDMTEVT